MTDSRARVELAHTAVQPLPGSVRRSEAPAPEERITVTVIVRSRAGADAIAEALAALASRAPHERAHLSHEEHERQFGGTAEDLAAVQAFAAEHGLEVLKASPARRTVELSGPLSAFSRAFGVRFHRYDHEARPYLSHEGPATVPAELHGVIENVLGLDDRPLLLPGAGTGTEASPAIEKLLYTDPRTIASFYQFPTGVTGAGQCVALLQFGGGFYPSDMETYFRLRGLNVPAISVIEIDGQTNQPASPQVMLNGAAKLNLLTPEEAAKADPAAKVNFGAFFATVECTMDLQILGTIVPDARLVTYMAPDTAKGQYDAFSRAISDADNSPRVINCSWGSCENQSQKIDMTSLDQLFQQAALKGITICCSAGDYGNGASSCGGQPTGHFPATSPYALAVGGTSIPADLSRETPWSETLSGLAMSGGGGYSQEFVLPQWQKDAGVSGTGRGFPDVAAKADIMNGYDVVVAGLNIPMGGTSAAAPLWAGLVALINQKLGRPVGYLTPLLYSKNFAGAVRDIAPAGWDENTGLGSPNGEGLLTALSAEPHSD
jgi:kumamolisin